MTILNSCYAMDNIMTDIINHKITFSKNRQELA